ncbi:Uncharacterised protein [Candidatus Venteria ishoeyi]|uniref:Uncharacterized protein n=1 Tax=Candidatus Venteria ishoeyi TaxID=1899563 RepID=A0A1H6F7E0_9GAMM|nr:Uncharacterised protein [Candidatus Venteria ishoeyi]
MTNEVSTVNGGYAAYLSKNNGMLADILTD